MSEDESKRKVALEIFLLNLKSPESDSLDRNKSLEGDWYKYDGDLLSVSLFRGFLTLEEVKYMCLRQSSEEVYMVKVWGLSNHLSQPRNESPRIPTPCQPLDETTWLQLMTDFETPR